MLVCLKLGDRHTAGVMTIQLQGADLGPPSQLAGVTQPANCRGPQLAEKKLFPCGPLDAFHVWLYFDERPNRKFSCICEANFLI